MLTVFESIFVQDLLRHNSQTWPSVSATLDVFLPIRLWFAWLHRARIPSELGPADPLLWVRGSARKADDNFGPWSVVWPPVTFAGNFNGRGSKPMQKSYQEWKSWPLYLWTVPC